MRRSPPNKATFWRQATPGSAWWRTQIPARHLPGKVVKLGFDDIVPDNKGEPSFPRQEGAAIWQFPGNEVRALMMRGMRQLGIPVLVEVDDNYLIPPSHGMSQWAHTRATANGDHSYQAHMEIVANECDGVIVSTPFLRDIYRKVNPLVSVCPNAIDPEEWADDGDDSSGRPRGDRLTIGYAAPFSHQPDLSLVRRALLSKRVVDGGRDFNRVLIGELRHPNAEHVPWTNDLAEYRRNLQLLDVGLCPLKPTAWNRCKSDIKAMEYAMSGALPIVQKAEAYRDWYGIVPTCETAKDWERAVQWCVRNPDRVTEMAKAAKEFVLAEKTINRHIDKWEEAIDSGTRSRSRRH